MDCECEFNGDGRKGRICGSCEADLLAENERLREALRLNRFWLSGYVDNGGKGATEQLALTDAALSEQEGK